MKRNGHFKTSMLEYFKILLSKIQFDRGLLEKEYRKSLQFLEATERKELERWLREMK